MFSLGAFKDRGSALLLTGQLLSQVCDKMMTLGLVWVICAELSTDFVPWFLAIGALPHLLLSWSAGGWAARFGALKTVMWTDFARGVIFLAAGAGWTSIGEGHQLPALVMITLAANVAAALFNPAVLSLPVQMADEATAPQLTAALDASFSFSNILGPACVALLYPWLGLRGLFVLTGVSYFVAGLAASGIRLRAVGVAEAPAPAPGNALALLRDDPLILFLLCAFFCMNLALTPLMAFLPLFAKTQLGGQIGTLAGMEASVGIGTVAGGLALSVVRLEARTWTRVTIGLAITSLMYLLFSVNRSASAADVFLLVLGLALSLVNISLLTFFQTRPRASDVPVVMGLVNLISVGALPFSMLMLGGALSRVELHPLAVSLALVLGLVTAVTASHREFRNV